MAGILGGTLGCWLLYALLALIFKHKIALIITFVIGMVGGIAMISVGDISFIISSLIAIALIYFIVPIQVRSDKKKQGK